MTLADVKIWLQTKFKSVRVRQDFLELIRLRRSRSPAEIMNSSHQIQNEFPGNCVLYSFIGGKPDRLSYLSIFTTELVVHSANAAV